MIKYTINGDTIYAQITIHPLTTELEFISITTQVFSYLEGYNDIRILLDCRALRNHLNELGKYRVANVVEEVNISLLHCALLLSPEGKRHIGRNLLQRVNTIPGVTVKCTTDFNNASWWLQSIPVLDEKEAS